MTPLRYGLIAQPGSVFPSRGEGYPFGMYAASQGASRALLRDSRAEEVLFACSPFALVSVREEVARAGSVGRDVRPRVESVDHLLRDGVGETNAWVDFGGDVVRPHCLRNRVGGDYPIGVVQHSVSYGYAIHSWFLPLLLGDVREHDAVLCTSVAARESVRKVLGRLAEDLNAAHGTKLRYHGRLEVIPLGVDVEHFRPMSREEARRRFRLADGETVVLFAGRISAQDKADLLPFLRVFRDLSLRHSNLRLVLAGAARGDEMQVVSRCARDLGILGQVTPLGLVPRDLLPVLYASSDVFVSPADSFPETFGLTCIEAMACGIPVVASDWNGYRDTITHGETGFLVDTEVGDLSLADDLSLWSLSQGEMLDVYAASQATVVQTGQPMDVSGRDPGVRSIYGALECLINNPNLRYQMGQAGRKRVLERYVWPVVVRQYDDLFDDLRRVPAEVRPGECGRTHLAETFSHYPTRWIEDETRVRAVDGVFAKVAGLVVRNPRPELGLVSEEVARRVFEALRESRDGRMVQDLVEAVDAPDIRFHVAWLVKHGYVETVEEK